MSNLFESLDTLLDLPFPAFEKKLAKLEEEFRDISVTDIDEEELEGYFLRIKKEYEILEGDLARVRLEMIGYLCHFDTLIEKYFPEYVALFQASFERKDSTHLMKSIHGFLAHMDEILREYTHRLSDPDNYPSYTGHIQELIQNALIDLYFWLQERETERERCVSASERNTDLTIQLSRETRDGELRFIRQCLELMNEGVLEKIFFDHEYPHRVSQTDTELPLIGRYEHKKQI